jgi:hypothetical protein
MLDDEENSLFGGASDIDDDDLEKKKDVKSGGTIDGDKKNLFRKELRAMLYGFGDQKLLSHVYTSFSRLGIVAKFVVNS